MDIERGVYEDRSGRGASVSLRDGSCLTRADDAELFHSQKDVAQEAQ